MSIFMRNEIQRLRTLTQHLIDENKRLNLKVSDLNNEIKWLIEELTNYQRKRGPKSGETSD